MTNGTWAGNSAPSPLGTCHCFSMCHVDEARLFLSRLPHFVTTRSSPWFDYLDAVYHGRVRLPFDLTRLRLFYRDTANWRNRTPRPRVGLPLQRCEGRPRPREWARSITDRTKFVYGDRRHRRCSERMCRSWLTSGGSGNGAGSGASAPVPWRPIAITFRDDYVELRLLSGNYTPPLSHRRGALPSSPRYFPEPRMQVDYSWVEVMRSDFTDNGTREGQAGYGCWFYPMVGTGFFIQIGRSFRAYDGRAIADRACASDPGCRSPLITEFLAATNRTVDDIPVPAGDYGEIWPYAAHEIGYDSLQVHRRHNLSGDGELIVTTDACAHAAAPVRTCPPFEVRTGSRHELVCRCSERRAVLNCEGGTSDPKSDGRGGAGGGGGGGRGGRGGDPPKTPPATPQHGLPPPPAPQPKPPRLSAAATSSIASAARSIASVRRTSGNGTRSLRSWVLGRLPSKPLPTAGAFPAWDAYLRQVYGDSVRYPVDLRAFTWFYSIPALPLIHGGSGGGDVGGGSGDSDGGGGGSTGDGRSGGAGRGGGEMAMGISEGRVEPLLLGPADPPAFGHAWIGRCERAHVGCDPESFGVVPPHGGESGGRANGSDGGDASKSSSAGDRARGGIGGGSGGGQGGEVALNTPGFFVQHHGGGGGRSDGTSRAHHQLRRAGGGSATAHANAGTGGGDAGSGGGGGNGGEAGGSGGGGVAPPAHVEVMRVAVAHVDEIRGAWYWEAKGSGIWLRLGASVIVDGPRSLARIGVDPSLANRTGPALQLLSAIRALRKYDTVVFPRGSQAWMTNIRAEVVDLRAPGLAPTRHIRSPTKLKEYFLTPIKGKAAEADGRQAKLDTPFYARTCVPTPVPRPPQTPQTTSQTLRIAQTQAKEVHRGIAVAAPAVTAGAAATRPSVATATPSSPYRAGWQASLPCMCDGGPSFAMLNCGGRFPPFRTSAAADARDRSTSQGGAVRAAAPLTPAHTSGAHSPADSTLGRMRYVSTWHLRSPNSGSWRKTVVRQLGLEAWEVAVAELTSLRE